MKIRDIEQYQKTVEELQKLLNLLIAKDCPRFKDVIIFACVWAEKMETKMANGCELRKIAEGARSETECVLNVSFQNGSAPLALSLKFLYETWEYASALRAWRQSVSESIMQEYLNGVKQGDEDVLGLC